MSGNVKLRAKARLIVYAVYAYAAVSAVVDQIRDRPVEDE